MCFKLILSNESLYFVLSSDSLKPGLNPLQHRYNPHCCSYMSLHTATVTVQAMAVPPMLL